MSSNRVLVAQATKFFLCLLGLQLLLGGYDTATIANAAAAPTTSEYFPQTAHTVSGLFLDYWQQHGSLSQFGYPITDEFFDGYERVQYFERARLEYHPELAGTSYQVELALLGSQTLARANRSFPSVPQPTSSNPNVFYFKETGHTLRGVFLTYWQQHGGLQVFGFPLSKEIQEVSPTDGKTYTVQYFERNRFEYHPELAGSSYEIELGLLGSEALKVQAQTSNISPTATISLDGKATNQSIGNIVGANIETFRYSYPGETLHPDWSQTIPDQMLQLTQNLEPTDSGQKFALTFGTQFDGGRMTGTRAGGADGYHWLQAFNPNYGFMNLDDVADFSRRLNANLAVQVNFGSGTVQEAANEVAYANGTDATNSYVQLRQKHGFNTPYNITNWYIGGELFDAGETGFSATGDYSYANPNSKNGGDPAWYNKPTSDPANYAARAVSFAQAMRKASPVPIKIYLSLSVPGSEWGSIKHQLEVLLAGAGSQVDGFVLHLYPVAEGARSGLTDLDILGAPERSQEWVQEAENDLQVLAPTNKHYDLLLSEYNISIHNISQLNNLAGGVAIAAMLTNFANQGVSIATHYSLETGTYGLYYYNADGKSVTPRPSYAALQLFATHLGSQLVNTNVTGSPTLQGPGGTEVAGFPYPAVVATASVSSDKTKLYVIATNRSPDQAVATTFNIANLTVPLTTTPTTVQAIMLNGVSLDSTSDSEHLQEVGLVSVQFTVSSLSQFNFNLPAHSVVAFTIPLQKEGN